MDILNYKLREENGKWEVSHSTSRLRKCYDFLRIIRQSVTFPSKAFVFFNSTILLLQTYANKILKGCSSQPNWKKLNCLVKVNWLKFEKVCKNTLKYHAETEKHILAEY